MFTKTTLVQIFHFPHENFSFRKFTFSDFSELKKPINKNHLTLLNTLVFPRSSLITRSLCLITQSLDPNMQLYMTRKALSTYSPRFFGVVCMWSNFNEGGSQRRGMGGAERYGGTNIRTGTMGCGWLREVEMGLSGSNCGADGKKNKTASSVPSIRWGTLLWLLLSGLNTTIHHAPDAASRPPRLREISQQTLKFTILRMWIFSKFTNFNFTNHPFPKFFIKYFIESFQTNCHGQWIPNHSQCGRSPTRDL